MDRRVDGVQLHGLIAGIGDVVPRPGRNEYAPTVADVVLDCQVVFSRTHLDLALAGIEAEKLVVSWCTSSPMDSPTGMDIRGDL